MKTFRVPILAFVGLLSSVLAAAASDFGQTVRDFSANRQALVRNLSSQLNLPLPKEAEAFFQATATGLWESVSNAFVSCNPHSPSEPLGSSSALHNEMWPPILETYGVWEVWKDWKEDSSLLAHFYEPILASMPAGSIYFGGTDPGRFAVTAANALRDPPPVFCLTQNALADNSYMAYLRATCGDRIWLPSQEESTAAFHQYVNDVKAGHIPASAGIKVEDGKVSIQGVDGVMQINGNLAQLIFDHNKADHPFFVEESYVIPWMYPHLEPYGLILKMNADPLPELSPETIARDRQFWDETESRLTALPGFAGNDGARKIFSKLRSAGAGVYEYRKLDAEAEAAFRQAIRLCPFSPEANFRLADMLIARQRPSEAVQVMEDYLSTNPEPDQVTRAKEYLQQLKETQKQNNRPGDAGDPRPSTQAS